MKFVSNPALPFIIDDYPGNPISESGRFRHPDYPFELTWKDVLKWKSKPNPYAKAKKKETWRPKVINDDSFLRSNNDLFVWLGHASFFFRLNGKNILIDPVFGQLSFLMPRFSELPIKADKFTNIDYVLLTHDHRDHLDISSLKLLAQNNSRAQFICGLHTTAILSDFVKEKNIMEMGWYQQFTDEENELAITYLPTRHWCRRYLTDTNKRLWGAYVFETGDRTIYFGGDSGYGDHFQEMAELYPDIDLAFLGIGAFAPVWFMQSNHMSPSAAFQAFKDLHATKMVPMHYGTFDLSDEPLGEPLRLMRSIHDENNLNGEIIFSKIGESRPLS